MDYMPFYLVFLQSLPETLILVYLGLVLTGTKSLAFTRAFFVALLTSIVSYFMHKLSLPLGTYVFLQLPVLIVCLVVIGRLSFIYSAIISCIGFIFLCLGEGILNYFISYITGFSLPTVMANPLLRILFPIPEFLILSGCIFLIWSKKIVLFDLRSLLNLEEDSTL